MAPSNGTTSKLVVTLPPNHSTLQWHLQWHPAMAPCNGTQQWQHVHCTQQWHQVRSLKVGRHPRPLPQSWSSPHHSTLQWHPAMAPSNGTTSTPPKLVVTLPLNHSTLQWHPTMAPSNGTTSTAPCNGTLVPRPIRL